MVNRGAGENGYFVGQEGLVDLPTGLLKHERQLRLCRDTGDLDRVSNGSMTGHIAVAGSIDQVVDRTMVHQDLEV